MFKKEALANFRIACAARAGPLWPCAAVTVGALLAQKRQFLSFTQARLAPAFSSNAAPSPSLKERVAKGHPGDGKLTKADAAEEEEEEGGAEAAAPAAFIEYSDISRTPFFDDSIGKGKSGSGGGDADDGSGAGGGGRGRGATADALARRKRRGYSRAGGLTAEEKAKAQQHIAAVVERAKMEDPRCLDYPLHTFKEISPVVYRSVKAHSYLFDYVSTRDDIIMRKRFSEKESMYKAEFLGKALYFRVVNLHKLPSHTGLKDAAVAAKMEKAVLAGVKRIVLDYAQQFIQPFPNEIACDVSHYAATAPYVAEAKLNVEQFVLDAKSLREHGTIEKKGRSGSPTPARRLQPLSPDEVAKEMAGRISREVLKPLAHQHFGDKTGRSSSSSAAEDSYGGFRVCIGIAPTPALAKIGCDAEVLHVQRHPDKNAHRAPVRVRSLYTHIRTLRDSKNFMAPFRVAHVAVFTPAFARFLQVVFGVDTCAQLYDKREELYFSLSRETFNLCYDAAFGRMRFPAEESHLLHCPDNIRKTNGMLEVLATNAIAIADSTRSAVRAGFLRLNKTSISSSNFTAVDARLNYGRLSTDAQFLEVALRTVQKGVERLHRKGFTAAGLRMDLRKGTDMQCVVTKSFPATNNYAQLMTYGRQAATVLAPRRQQKGKEESGEFFCVTFTLTRLDVAVMIPARLQAEVDAVKKAYLDARFFHSADSVQQRRLKSATGDEAVAALEAGRKPRSKGRPTVPSSKRASPHTLRLIQLAEEKKRKV